jgi:hypothetical protein
VHTLNQQQRACMEEIASIMQVPISRASEIAARLTPQQCEDALIKCLSMRQQLTALLDAFESGGADILGPPPAAHAALALDDEGD